MYIYIYIYIYIYLYICMYDQFFNQWPKPYNAPMPSICLDIVIDGMDILNGDFKTIMMKYNMCTLIII